MMRCPNCNSEIWVGKPLPAGDVQVGDRIKVTIEEAECTVVLRQQWHRDAVELRTRHDSGQEFDHYLGTDHTVWLVKREAKL